MPELTIEQALELALREHQAGRLAEAEAICRQILAAKPDHADCLHVLGVIAHQTRRAELAIELVGRAVAIDPNLADYHNTLGMVLNAQGRGREAIAALQTALHLNPDFAEAHNNLGNALKDQGQIEEAAQAFARAAQLKPVLMEAHFNLGNILKQLGRNAAAVRAYRDALALAPNFVEGHLGLGNALTAQGLHGEAVDAYRAAVGLKPDFVMAHNNLGTALQRQGKFDEAIEAYRTALTLKPDLAEAYSNLGSALRAQRKFEQAADAFRAAIRCKADLAPAYHDLGLCLNELGDYEQAADAFRAAMRAHPDDPEAHYNLGRALHSMNEVDAAQEEFRTTLALNANLPSAHNSLGNTFKDQARLDEAFECYRRAITLEPIYQAPHHNLIYVMHFHPGRDMHAIRTEMDHWRRTHAEPLRKFIQPHGNERDPDRRLRIGYVSTNFRHQAECHFVVPLLEAHDHEQFEIHCYASIRRPDVITERLKESADAWHDVLGLDDEQLAAKVRADGIDILVDLHMHMGDDRLMLFARKPAPVQVTWLAYPGSTGLDTVDYRLTDAYMDPPSADESWATEAAIRLPDSWCCYHPVSQFPLLVSPPVLRNGHVTFGSFNNFCKNNDQVLERWARVMQAVSGSRLILLCPKGQTRDRVRAFFQERGIDRARIDFEHNLPRPIYLSLYNKIDIALDPFPYNGITTTCDAMWMGVPVLTLPGTTPPSRAGLSLLENAGFPEWVAKSEENYIRLAIELANDVPRLSELRSTLQDRVHASPLMDGPRFARNVEAAFRQIWRRWCADRTSMDPLPAPQPAQAEPASPQYRQGLSLAEAGQWEGAAEAFRDAIRVQSDHAKAHAELGRCLQTLAQPDAAIDSCRTAIALDPKLVSVHNTLGNALKDRAQLDEAIEAFRQCMSLRPDLAFPHSNLIYTLHVHPAYDMHAIRREQDLWSDAHAKPLARFMAPHANDRKPDRRLKVGYVSPNFYQQAECHFVLPLLESHDRGQVEVHCYSSVPHPDAVTALHQAQADVWHDVASLDDEQLAAKIRADRIDILVDLTMHMGRQRLPTFARKPAPVQVTWLAYPGTTGLAAMDYRLTDAYLDRPGGDESWSSERLLRLADSWCCYHPVTEYPPVSPTPVLKAGHVTFGSLNNFAKCNDLVLRRWARVLEAVTDSKLLLMCPPGEARKRVHAFFRQCGIDPGRIEFEYLLPRRQYLDLYDRIDIALDPFPYNGITTTCDALWMGVPVLTLPGETPPSRAGLSMLINGGFPQWVAKSEEDYMRLATDMANDVPRLSLLRSTLRERVHASPLMDGPRFARNVEAAFRQTWRNWCTTA